MYGGKKNHQRASTHALPKKNRFTNSNLIEKFTQSTWITEHIHRFTIPSRWQSVQYVICLCTTANEQYSWHIALHFHMNSWQQQQALALVAATKSKQLTKKNMHSSHIRYIGVNECPLESEYRNANVAIRCIWKPLKQHSKKNALQIRMAQQRVAAN